MQITHADYYNFTKRKKQVNIKIQINTIHDS